MFLCLVCRRDRKEAAYVGNLPCCGETFRICADECVEMIERVCGRMTVKGYAELYERVHTNTCQIKKRRPSQSSTED